MHQIFSRNNWKYVDDFEISLLMATITLNLTKAFSLLNIIVQVIVVFILELLNVQDTFFK